MSTPPKIWTRLLKWYCKKPLQESILGDLTEQFEIDIHEKSRFAANTRFAWNVIRFFRPGIIRSFSEHQKISQFSMFQNNLKIAIRVFARERFYATINIAGLALGFAACLLILGYIRFETSYENHLTNKNEIYRVLTSRTEHGRTTKSGAKGPGRLAQVAPTDISGVQVATRAYFEPCLIRTENKKLADQAVYWVDKDFFQVFKGILISGNPLTVLDGPLKMVITESKAKTLFGDQNPLGQLIKVNEGMPFKVTGVMKDPPANTHFKYDYLNSISTFVHYGWISETASWDYDSDYLYLAIDTHSKSDIQQAINDLVASELKPKENAGRGVTFELQPIQKIHLHSHLGDEPEVNGDITHIYMVSGIGIAILVIVLINFVNLSTALSLKRAKDTGVRKTFGASRGQLRIQYLTESILLNIIAATLAVLMVSGSESFLSGLLKISFDFSLITDIHFWFWALATFLLCICAVGFYPAVILSSFSPIVAMKGKMKDGKTSRNSVKQVLLTFQFSASIFLTVGAFVVYQQVSFMRNFNLGINTDQVIIMSAPSTLNAAWDDYERIAAKVLKYERFKQSLLPNSFVKSVASSVNIPGQESKHIFNSISLQGSGEEISAKIEYREVDQDFFPIYEVEFLAGENLKQDLLHQRWEAVINEKAAELLGYQNPKDAIGQNISNTGDHWKIIGVVADFHIKSLSEPIQPAIFTNRHPHEFGYYLAEISPENIEHSLNVIESQWREIYPEDPFVLQFSDAYFNQQYQKYEQFGSIFNFLTILAIFIANLGLIALVSLAAAERLKEIGIRKVLGANWWHVTILMSRHFMIMIGLASLVALPLAWIFLKDWLDSFAYHIDISFIAFIGCAIFISAVALFNILYYVQKVLRYNPTEILRDE